jgi:hypothetical protein
LCAGDGCLYGGAVASDGVVTGGAGQVGGRPQVGAHVAARRVQPMRRDNVPCACQTPKITKIFGATE